MKKRLFVKLPVVNYKREFGQGLHRRGVFRTSSRYGGGVGRGGIGGYAYKGDTNGEIPGSAEVDDDGEVDDDFVDNAGNLNLAAHLLAYGNSPLNGAGDEYNSQKYTNYKEGDEESPVLKRIIMEQAAQDARERYDHLH